MRSLHTTGSVTPPTAWWLRLLQTCAPLPAVSSPQMCLFVFHGSAVCGACAVGCTPAAREGQHCCSLPCVPIAARQKLFTCVCVCAHMCVCVCLCVAQHPSWSTQHQTRPCSSSFCHNCYTYHRDSIKSHSLLACSDQTLYWVSISKVKFAPSSITLHQPGGICHILTL